MTDEVHQRMMPRMNNLQQLAFVGASAHKPQSMPI